MEFQEELGYDGREDPGVWKEKMQRVQQIHGYDDANTLLLAHLCLKGAALQWCRVYKPCTIQDLYVGLIRRFAKLAATRSTTTAPASLRRYAANKGSHDSENGASVDGSKTPGDKDSTSISNFSSEGGGEGFLKYPRSSFVINCAGDMCVGDVIVFDQKLVLNNTLSKVGSVGNFPTRTVAGRIVGESDGPSAQESTFTIEVYWSKGVKAVSAERPFVIKARSLELLKPHRQYWGNEDNRKRVLEEKQKRSQELHKSQSLAHRRADWSFKNTPR